MFNVEKLIKEKSKLPHLLEFDNYLLSSSVDNIDFNECLLNVLVINSTTMQAVHQKVTVSLNDLSFTNFEQSLINEDDLERYILENVLNKVKESDEFNRWFKGRIAFSVNKRKDIMELSSEFYVTDSVRTLINDYKLEDHLVSPIENEVNKLNHSSLETISHCKQRCNKNFSDSDILSKINTYHFDLKLSIVLEEQASFFCEKDLIYSFDYDIIEEVPETKWISHKASPFYNNDYNLKRKERLFSNFSDDIIDPLQNSFNSYVESLHTLEEISINELLEMDEIREYKEMSLRKETPLYRYYIMDEKVVVEKFSLKTNEWEFM